MRSVFCLACADRPRPSFAARALESVSANHSRQMMITYLIVVCLDHNQYGSLDLKTDVFKSTSVIQGILSKLIYNTRLFTNPEVTSVVIQPLVAATKVSDSAPPIPKVVSTFYTQAAVQLEEHSRFVIRRALIDGGAGVNLTARGIVRMLGLSEWPGQSLVATMANFARDLRSRACRQAMGSLLVFASPEVSILPSLIIIIELVLL